MNTDNACFFTGHRDIPPEIVDTLKHKLNKEIVRMIKSGTTVFCAGGALGFDTLAAEEVIELKKTYPEIKLVLCLPYPGQAARWGKANKERYLKILSSSDRCIYALESYTKYCMHARNRMLVDMASKCICYKTSEKGGTAYTVSLAEKKNCEIINLADDVYAEQLSVFH